MKLILFILIFSFSFCDILIKDDTGTLTKEFINNIQSTYKDNRKQIHVLIKKSIGDIKPVVFGAEYISNNDLGGEDGTGIVILHVVDIRWVQVIVGYKIENEFTDNEINNIITKSILKEFKNGNFEKGYITGIENSEIILNEVIK